VPGPEEEFADDFHALAELAEAFLELVSHLSEHGSTAITAEQVVRFAARCMPHAHAVAVGMQTDGALCTVASTGDQVAATVDVIRAETEQGPSLDVIETSDVVISNDLAADGRWPGFGRRAHREAGVAALATYRLYLGASARGSLTFYSEWSHAFDELAIAIGAIFAAYASLVLSHGGAPSGAVPAARAESVHAEIGVAVGILLSGTERTADDGYRRLHEAGRRLHETLPDTASDAGSRSRDPED